MKKNILLIMVMLVYLFALSGCEELQEQFPGIAGNQSEEAPPLSKPEPEEPKESQEVFAAATPSLAPESSPEPTPEPTPEPEPEPSPSTEAPPVMPEEVVRVKVDIPEVSGYPEHNFGSPYNADGSLSNEKMAWYFNRNTDHVPPSAQSKYDIRQFDGYYLGDTGSKAVYLTFDEGYENGYTEQILDVLKEKGVTAAFFVTKPYITSNPELIQRMVDEGHVVGNHSVTHQSFPSLTDEEVVWELEETARTYKELTGEDMPPFFRPPMGEYSARTLYLSMEAGYKSIFWSFAYRDWVVDDQPGKAAAYDTIMKDLHNGQIPLLHAVSQSNTEALGDVIDSYKEHGYEFLSLYDLP